MFGDDQTVFRKLAPVAYQQDSGMAAENPVIKRFNLRLETRTTRVSRRDYDFEKPRILPEGAASSAFAPDLEDYDYPGRFTEAKASKDEDAPKFMRKPNNTRKPGVGSKLGVSGLGDPSSLLEPIEDEQAHVCSYSVRLAPSSSSFVAAQPSVNRNRPDSAGKAHA